MIIFLYVLGGMLSFAHYIWLYDTDKNDPDRPELLMGCVILAALWPVVWPFISVVHLVWWMRKK
jgi:hypothetical protein